MKKLCLFSLLLYSSSVVASSDWLHKIVKPVTGMRYSLVGLNKAKAIDADQECQNLGKEAQDALKVPSHKQLPIKYIPENASLFSKTYAVTGPDTIYVNHKNFNHLSYAEKRSILFHEAVHAKHNDATATERFLVKTTCLAGITKLGINLFPAVTSTVKKYVETTHSTLEKNGNAEWIYPLAACAIASSALYVLMNTETTEGRADRKGAYASDCYKCVRTQASKTPIRYGNEFDQESSLMQGYLSSQDLEGISKVLKSKNRLCKVHKEEKKAKKIAKQTAQV